MMCIVRSSNIGVYDFNGMYSNQGHLLKIRGFHQSCLRWCTMHTINLGICHWVVASILISVMNHHEDSEGGARLKLLFLGKTSPHIYC